jgi:hypothetical protein
MRSEEFRHSALQAKSQWGIHWKSPALMFMFFAIALVALLATTFYTPLLMGSPPAIRTYFFFLLCRVFLSCLGFLC